MGEYIYIAAALLAGFHALAYPPCLSAALAVGEISLPGPR